MSTPDILFAYFGPETFLPLTSIGATIVGILMMFGRHIHRMAARAIRLAFRKKAPAVSVKKPHFEMSRAVTQAESV